MQDRNRSCIDTRYGVFKAMEFCLLSALCQAASHVKRPNSNLFYSTDETIQEILAPSNAVYRREYFRTNETFLTLKSKIHQYENQLPPDREMYSAHNISSVVKEQTRSLLQMQQSAALQNQEEFHRLHQNIQDMRNMLVPTGMLHPQFSAIVPFQDRIQQSLVQLTRGTNSNSFAGQQMVAVGAENMHISEQETTGFTADSLPPTAQPNTTQKKKKNVREDAYQGWAKNVESIFHLYNEFRYGINGELSILVMKENKVHMGPNWSYNCPIYGEIDINIPTNATNEQEKEVLKSVDVLWKKFLKCKGSRKSGAWRKFSELLQYFHRNNGICIKGYQTKWKDKTESFTDEMIQLLDEYKSYRVNCCAANDLQNNRMEAWKFRWRGKVQMNYY